VGHAPYSRSSFLPSSPSLSLIPDLRSREPFPVINSSPTPQVSGGLLIARRQGHPAVRITRIIEAAPQGTRIVEDTRSGRWHDVDLAYSADSVGTESWARGAVRPEAD
jgi:hypothetical protein